MFSLHSRVSFKCGIGSFNKPVEAGHRRDAVRAFKRPRLVMQTAIAPPESLETRVSTVEVDLVDR